MRYTDPSGHSFFTILFSAVVGALSAVCGGIFGKAGSGAVKAVAKTGKGAVKEAAKRVVKAGVSEAAAGFATDTAKQILVEGKELQKVDFGQAVKTSAVAGATGMLGAVIGIFGESAKEALKKAKEPPKFGAAGGLRAETRGNPKGGYTTYSYSVSAPCGLSESEIHSGQLCIHREVC